MVTRQPAHGPVALAVALAALLAGGARIASADPTTTAGTRTLLLVRHGEYDHDDPRNEAVGKGLVAIGRDQARAVAGRLASWPQRVAVLRSSPLTRARETAAIVAARLRLEPEMDADLAECTPPSPRPDIQKDLDPVEADSCRLRLDRLAARLFRPTAAGDTVEAVICHGNVIRYLVCRALGVDPTAWGQMGIANCSVSEIQVRPDGAVRLMSYDDVGHLPGRLLTRGSRATPAPMR